MKIFSAAQIRNWDTYTIANEPITSIALMERAATACCKWLIGKNLAQKHFRIFCGKGNNGGDGLALARLLIEHECLATVYILEFGNIGTPDFQSNLEKLHQCSIDIHFIQAPEFFPAIEEDEVVIDALFGTGLNKPLEGISAALVEHINGFMATVIAIDLPSGMYADRSSRGNSIIKATHTLSFQQQKLAFLVAENQDFCGEVHILHIGLHPDFEDREETDFELTDKTIIRACYKPRDMFSHKGSFGHAVLVTGSIGMMGAAILSARACLRSGAGKLTSYIPKCGYSAFQAAVPEAMCVIAGDEYVQSVNDLTKADAIGIGPGLGIYSSAAALLKEIFLAAAHPLLIDADALNIISQNRELLELIPAYSVLTPHLKEFERIFGPVSNDFERLQLAMQKSKEFNICIIIKGHYSFITTPGGKNYFNSTGNPGMATAGSGDVLSGIITALLAQGYQPADAAVMGAWLHGLAGDIAAERLSQEAMIASDIISCLPEAFKQLVNGTG